jgi:hypothetical protein
MVFETPSHFVLRHADEQAEEHIFCTRQPQPPSDAELPPDVHWSYQGSQALAKAPRREQALTGKSSEAGAAVVRLYRREASASDGGRDNIPFSSTSAVVAIGSDSCIATSSPALAPPS